MTDQFLSLLRCPFCGEALETFKTVEENNNEIEWGIIKCSGCEARFPVAFGIPIIKPAYNVIDTDENINWITYKPSKKEVLVADITKNIEDGNISKVKEELLFYRLPRTSVAGIFKKDNSIVYNNKLTNILPNKVVKVIGRRNLHILYWMSTKLTLQDKRLKKKEEEIHQKLANASSADEFMLNYYDLLNNKAMYNYFAYRFGQPRYLVALSLFTTLPDDKKPILDLACGPAHLFHYLSYRNPDQPLIGIERNFAKLYAAKKFIAPKGNYICGEADMALPFEDNLFSSVFVSDAFPYFTYRELTVREMKRVLTPDGVTFITHVSSTPLEGYAGNTPNPPEKLKSYFQDMPNIVFRQDDVWGRYLKKYGPDFSGELPLEELNKAVWISVVASHRKNYFRDYGKFKDWPHALGKIRLNPLYHFEGKDNKGNNIYKFRFPSKWYELDAPHWKDYAPEEVHISPETLEAIAKGNRTPEVDDLLAKWVVIGMPEKYLPPDTDS